MSSENKWSQTFAAYIRTRKVAGDPGAAALAAYCPTHDTRKHYIVTRIRADLANDVIDKQRHDDLLAFLADFYAEYSAGPKLLDVRDGRDWKQLPGGGRQRINHIAGDQNDIEARQDCATKWRE